MDVARSSFKVFLAEVFGVILSFGSILYFARELGSATIGVYFLFQGLLFVLSKPADLGTRFAAEKRISEGDSPASYLTTAILMKVVFLAVTLLGLYLARVYVNDYLGADLVGLLGVALVVREMSGLMKNTLSGELRVGETAFLDFSYELIKYGGGVALVYAGFGVVGLIVSLIAGQFARFLLALRAQSTGFDRPRLEQVRSLFDYAKFTIIPSVGTEVYQWMDVLIIGLFMSHSAVGAYEIAWRIGAPVLLLSRSISVTVFPQISAWESSGSREAIESLFSSVITPSLFLVFPAFFGTLVLSQEILTIVFGAEYGIAWLALIVIMAGKIPGGLRNLTGRSLYGLDKPRLVTIASVFDIIANILLNVVFILQFGIVGAAVGTAVAVTIGTLIRAHFLSRLIEIDVPYDELSWCILASAGMAAVLYVAKTTVEINSVVLLGGFVFAGAALYGFFVLLYSPIRNQITSQIRANLS